MTQPQTQTDAVAKLTRANIRARIGALQIRERELTDRAAAMYASGQIGSGAHLQEKDRRIHDLAKTLLNGAGGLLAPLAEGQSEADVMLEREGVRLALSVLQKADFEQAAVEAAEKAVKVTPEWKSIQREWIVNAIRWAAIELRAQKFRNSIGPEACQALPPDGGLPIGVGAEIDLGLRHWPVPGHRMLSFESTIDDLARFAIENGVISHSDVDRARRGKVEI